TARTAPGVRPSISLARLPAATSSPVSTLRATTLGSSRTMPRSRAWIRVLAVPRSIARSRDMPWRARRTRVPPATAEAGEPDADLALGRLRRVRAVHDVLVDRAGPLATEVAADRARGRLGRFGRTREGTEPLDALLALDHDGCRGTGGHELQ